MAISISQSKAKIVTLMALVDLISDLHCILMQFEWRYCLHPQYEVADKCSLVSRLLKIATHTAT